MSELSPENRALIKATLGHCPFPDEPRGLRQGFTSEALNALLNAAREEGPASPPTSEGGA